MSIHKFINITSDNGKHFVPWSNLIFSKKIRDYEKKKYKEPFGKYEIKKHQYFVQHFSNFYSIYKNMLIYHGVGTGKTITVLNLLYRLKSFAPNWNLIILVPAALKIDPWQNTLDLLKQDNNLKNILFANTEIHIVLYDVLNADKVYNNVMVSISASAHTFIIIDECHQFISNVRSNLLKTQGGKTTKAYNIYTDIIQRSRGNKMIKILALSATPIVNYPFEAALLFNLLRPFVFPQTEKEFNEVYVTQHYEYKTINPESINMFQRRIMGLVSYYEFKNTDLFAEDEKKIENISMSKYQEKVYKQFTTKNTNHLYLTYSDSLLRNISNFVYPNPANYPKEQNIGKKELFHKLIKKIVKESEFYKDVQLYKKYLEEKKEPTFDEFIKLHIKSLSRTFQFLYVHSCKMTAILLYIFTYTKQLHLIYSRFVNDYGINILKLLLNALGWQQYSESSHSSYDYKRYAEFTGNFVREERAKFQAVYNQSENKQGKKIRVMFISSAGIQGVNFKNVRYLHMLEPHWNVSKLKQIEGRAIRMNSHIDLPKEERKVKIIYYIAIKQNSENTIDHIILQTAIRKERLIQSFLDAIKSVAIDCHLYNQCPKNYECFQFNLEDMIEMNKGPVFKRRVLIDKILDNGTNAKNSVKIPLQTIKIKGKIFINHVDRGIYDLLLEKESSLVFHPTEHFPVGKASFILDKETNKKIYEIKDEVYVIKDLFYYAKDLYE